MDRFRVPFLRVCVRVLLALYFVVLGVVKSMCAGCIMCFWSGWFKYF